MEFFTLLILSKGNMDEYSFNWTSDYFTIKMGRHLNRKSYRPCGSYKSAGGHFTREQRTLVYSYN